MPVSATPWAVVDDGGQFNIDPDSGVVRYNEVQTVVVTHSIEIIATDAAGNTATQAVDHLGGCESR